MDPKDIRVALGARQVEVSPPVTNGMFAEFERTYKVSLCSNFRKIYSEFNGYLSHDPKSMITIWPLQAIGENIELFMKSNATPDNIAFGDYLFDSDLIVADISRNDSIVCLKFENRVLASSLIELFERIVLGNYDFFN